MTGTAVTKTTLAMLEKVTVTLITSANQAWSVEMTTVAVPLTAASEVRITKL